MPKLVIPIIIKNMNINRINNIFVKLLAVFIVLLTMLPHNARSETLVLASGRYPTPVFYLSGNDPAMLRASNTLETFFNDRHIKVEILNSMMYTSLKEGKTLFALETEYFHPIAKRFGLDLSVLRDQRDESHIIYVGKHNHQSIVIIVGKSASGTEAGANFLLSKIHCELDANDWIIYSQTFKEFRRPFFRIREATLTPTGREHPNYPNVNYENWDYQRLINYPSFLKASGFNSLQLMELVTYDPINNKWRKGYRGGVPKGKKIEDVQDVLYTLMNAAHNEGMRVSQYIWGSPNDGYRWDNPSTRPLRQKFYQELAKRYGSKVDHIITHWRDEGTEGGYETPLTATMYIWNEFKKYNPCVEVTADAWFNSEIYDGIECEKFASKDVGIAVERWYDEERVEQISKFGRKVGIWGWYLSDFEMTYGSKLYTKTLDNYFKSLPEKAGEQVDWISLELCFHGMPSMINLYVVGRKMWNPKTSVSDIILDYCKAMYGESNADAMKFVYETVEEGQKEVRYGMVEKDRYPNVRNSTEFQAKVKKALNLIRQVKLDYNWKSNFSEVVLPQDDVKNLYNSLIGFIKPYSSVD